MAIDPNSITWDDAPVQQGAASGGPVYGPPPKPAAPPSLAEMARVDISQANLDLQREKFAYDQAKDAAKQGDPAQAEAAARVKLISTVGKLGQIGLDANDNKMFPGLGETGSLGQFKREWSPFNNPAKDLAGDLKTVDARFAFDALQAMREASKTGGALGSITENELELLKSSVANLNPNLSHDTFMKNVEEARQMYLSKLAMVDPQAAAGMGYNGEKAEQSWITANERYMKEMGINSEMNFERKDVATTQYPDDVQAIGASEGWGKAEVVN